MKNLILMLFGMSFLLSCNSDDDNKTQEEILENHFVYKGNEFQLEDYSYYYDFEENVLRIDVRDLGEDSQNKIEFSFYRTELSEIDGIYTYKHDFESPDYDPNANFYHAFVQYSPDGNDPEPFVAIGGEIEARVESNNIEIKFILETSEGTATGYFKGQLIENN